MDKNKHFIGVRKNERILNCNDFKNILKYRDVFKKLIEQHGACFGIHCKDCPFDSDNIIIGDCVNVDILETSKDILKFSKK